MNELSPNHEQLKTTPVIVVDIDGVLFDTPKHAVERWNRIHGTNYTVADIFDHNAKHDKHKFRDYHDAGEYEDTQGKFDDGFYAAQTDIANYLLIPGAREMLLRLKQEYGAIIHALTARDKANLHDVTLSALTEHYGIGKNEEAIIDELHFSGDPDFVGDKNAAKGKILRDQLNASVMIEDSIANAKSADEYNVDAIVLARPYNANGHDWPAQKTASDWLHMYELIVRSLEDQGYKKVA